jgi:hypothetical protein
MELFEDADYPVLTNESVSVSILPEVLADRRVRGNFLIYVYLRSRYDQANDRRFVLREALRPSLLSKALPGVGQRAAESAVEGALATGLLSDDGDPSSLAVMDTRRWFVRLPKASAAAAARWLGPDEARCWLWLLNLDRTGRTAVTLKELAERALGLRYNDRTARKAREALDGLGSKGLALVEGGAIAFVSRKAEKELKRRKAGRGKE